MNRPWHLLKHVGATVAAVGIAKAPALVVLLPPPWNILAGVAAGGIVHAALHKKSNDAITETQRRAIEAQAYSEEAEVIVPGFRRE